MRERLLLGAAMVLVVLGGVTAVAKGDGDGGSANVTLADGPVRDRVEWVLRLVNDGMSEPEIAAGFSDKFLASVPAPKVMELASQLRPAGPFAVEAVKDESDRSAVMVIRGPTGVAWKLSIAVAAEPPHEIEGLLFQPDRDEQAKPGSWSELDERLRAAAPDVAFLAAEIVDGECREVHAIAPDRVLPLGSAFKLYVLGALADEIEAGRASWDEMVAVTDEGRVHSSMTYGATPAGTQVSLRDLGTAMISVSDNTATDLVMARVGRAAIEAQQTAMGMADPSRNVPFVTTRELSLLKWGVPDDQRNDYIAADAARRLELLDALPARGATMEALGAATAAPTAIDDLEWFASPLDLCRAHFALQDKGGEVRRILGVNAGTGLDFDRDALPYIGFKGGSEPGVLALSWLAEHRDGRRLFVGALLKNRDEDVLSTVALDAAAAFDLLEQVSVRAQARARTLSPVAIELVGVTKRYGAVTALDELTLRVPEGEVFGFLGPNGAGKTTAMRAVFGIVEPDAGEIRWSGRPITRADRQRFGYMPEERGLYPRMRVLEQLVYLARLHGLTASDATTRAQHWLDVLDVGHRADDELDKLSLGNQQRVQLAAALVHEPTALVLDEPFSGLDPLGVDAVAMVLKEFAATGATVLFSSHQLDLVQHHCTSVAIVSAGRLVATGAVQELTAGDGRTFDVALDGELPALSGVTAVPGPRGWRLTLDEGVDPQTVIAALVAAARVTEFGVVRRPLSDVFREAVIVP